MSGARPPGPWVGDTVYDTVLEQWVIVTDVRQRDRPAPEYVLRSPLGGAPRWTTTDPARLRTDGSPGSAAANDGGAR